MIFFDMFFFWHSDNNIKFFITFNINKIYQRLFFIDFINKRNFDFFFFYLEILCLDMLFHLLIVFFVLSIYVLYFDFSIILNEFIFFFFDGDKVFTTNIGLLEDCSWFDTFLEFGIDVVDDDIKVFLFCMLFSI